MPTIYLLHLERPLSPGLHTAQHYLGIADNLDGRLAHHANGTGARFTAVAVQRGIAWEVARTWEGDRSLERRLKRWHASNRLCPRCRPSRRARDGRSTVEVTCGQ